MNSNKCANCDNDLTAKCSKCLVVGYCSVDCQKHDCPKATLCPDTARPKHKLQCCAKPQELTVKDLLGLPLFRVLLSAFCRHLSPSIREYLYIEISAVNTGEYLVQAAAQLKKKEVVYCKDRYNVLVSCRNQVKKSLVSFSLEESKKAHEVITGLHNVPRERGIYQAIVNPTKNQVAIRPEVLPMIKDK